MSTIIYGILSGREVFGHWLVDDETEERPFLNVHGEGLVAGSDWIALIGHMD